MTFFLSGWIIGVDESAMSAAGRFSSPAAGLRLFYFRLQNWKSSPPSPPKLLLPSLPSAGADAPAWAPDAVPP